MKPSTCRRLLPLKALTLEKSQKAPYFVAVNIHSLFHYNAKGKY